MGHTKKAKNTFLMEVEYRLFLLIPLLIRALSLKHAYALAKVCAQLFYMADFKHRKRAVTHILHSGIRTTLPEAKALARANFLHMLKVFIEVVKCDQIVTEENYHEHFRYESDSPELDKMIDPEHPALFGFPTEFYCNYQWWPMASGWRRSAGTAAVAPGWCRCVWRMALFT